MSHTYRRPPLKLIAGWAPRRHFDRIRLARKTEADAPAGGGAAFLIAAAAVVGLGIWALALAALL